MIDLPLRLSTCKQNNVFKDYFWHSVIVPITISTYYGIMELLELISYYRKKNSNKIVLFLGKKVKMFNLLYVSTLSSLRNIPCCQMILNLFSPRFSHGKKNPLFCVHTFHVTGGKKLKKVPIQIGRRGGTKS